MVRAGCANVAGWIPTSAYVDSLRPAGSKRSSKRDLIVNVFLRQEGHLTADDLVDLIRREDQRISRATVYRTLQWMVDAGIARKVDFGEGRFRFEHSYRHPRHFHLICKSCNRSFEFLSSDIEALVEEVAAARGFAPRQSVLQIHGTCEACQTGQPQVGGGRRARAAVRARCAAHRDRHRAQRPRVLQPRRERHPRRPRPAGVREARRRREGAPRHARGALPRAARSRTRSSKSRPTFLFFKGAANGLFAAGADQLTKGVDDLKALMIGIRCERGSHRFFKRYGERFEDSEGKQIFLEFADEETAAPRSADPRVPLAASSASATAARSSASRSRARIATLLIP